MRATGAQEPMPACAGVQKRGIGKGNGNERGKKKSECDFFLSFFVWHVKESESREQFRQTWRRRLAQTHGERWTWLDPSF